MSNSMDVTLGQAFQYAVEKLAHRRQVVFECSDGSNEQLRVENVEGVPSIIANKAGILALARLLITLGAAGHSEGFRLHVRQDFDGDRQEVLRIRVEEQSSESPATNQPTTPIV